MTESLIEKRRHSAAHLLAAAVLDLFPEAKLGIGPAIENGFYYDFLLPRTLVPEDLAILEDKIKSLINKKVKFERKNLDFAAAQELFEKLRQPFKLALLDTIKTEKITIYESANLTDLCQGPHVKDAGQLSKNGFKLTKTSGAYWKGDQKNKQLQRIYGLYFDSKKVLEHYLKVYAESERRDHRVLGEKLGLFRFVSEGPGLPFLLPKGTTLFNLLIDKVRAILTSGRYGKYQEIRTPLVLNEALWKKSGHFDHYKDNMYFTEIDGRGFVIRPMNCPGAGIVYRAELYSYRDLPVRLSEFGLVHRHELSGVLSGLVRVRAFTQDDAHIFCNPDQIAGEVEQLINLISDFYQLVGLKAVRLELSTRPEKFMGNPITWTKAEIILRKILKKTKFKFSLNPGEGAFYGPKIDFHAQDVLGRSWQLGTIQLDFQMPGNFGLSYIGEDGKKHTPVVIHRVVLGSVERFLAILIEHFSGEFPLWLAPVQVKVLTITSDQNKYAQKVADELQKAGIRVEFDDRPETLGKKIREAELQKIPYLAIIGGQEQKAKSISVRSRAGSEQREIKLDNFIESVKIESNKEG